MFYSQCLLSRKGPLGAVLIAAYCHSRLKKSQVLKTDIPFSIKKIMDEGFPTFTYRILGYLLLGVVRIYSQKVEYVLVDCNQMLQKAKQAVAAKQHESHGSFFLAPHQSITLPESLDLDKFIFEDMGVECRDHVLPTEEILLKDLWASEEAINFPPNGVFGEGISIDLESFVDAETPNHNHSSQHHVDMPLDDTLMSDMDAVERGIESLVQKFASCVEACDVEMVDLQAHLLSSPIISSVNNEKNEAQGSKQVETKPSDGERELAKELYVTVERSPERNPSDGAGAQLHKTLPTPVTREKVPVKRKRTCVIDEQLVLSNKVVKESIDYSGDLVRSRERVPRTALGVWTYGLMLDLKNNLTRPLIYCVLPYSNSCRYEYELTSTKTSPGKEIFDAQEEPVLSEDNKTYTDKEMLDGLEVPVVDKEGDHIAITLEVPVVDKEGDHIAITPEVPVVDKDGDHIAIAPETPHQDTRLDRFLLAEAFGRVRELSSSNTTEGEYEELPTEIYHSSETDFQEPDGWSASTRQAVQDLRSAFKNGNNEKVQVNLIESLRGKSKRTSAKMFYDVLVLKGRGMVNIQQDEPYGEILVTKSTAWEADILEE